MVIDRIKYAAIALGGIAAAIGCTLLYAQAVLVPAAEHAGRDKAVAAQAVKDVRAELERKGDDANLQTQTDFDLCVVGLRGNGMPVDACEQLRGVRKE